MWEAEVPRGGCASTNHDEFNSIVKREIIPILIKIHINIEIQSQLLLAIVTIKSRTDHKCQPEKVMNS